MPIQKWIEKKGGGNMLYTDAIEIGREEAFELCNCELPTKKKEQLIIRQVGHPQGNEVVFKENGRYYMAPFPKVKL